MSLKGDLQLDRKFYRTIVECYLVILFIDVDRKLFIKNPLTDPNNCQGKIIAQILIFFSKKTL